MIAAAWSPARHLYLVVAVRGVHPWLGGPVIQAQLPVNGAICITIGSFGAQLDGSHSLGRMHGIDGYRCLARNIMAAGAEDDPVALVIEKTSISEAGFDRSFPARDGTAVGYLISLWIYIGRRVVRAWRTLGSWHRVVASMWTLNTFWLRSDDIPILD